MLASDTTAVLALAGQLAIGGNAGVGVGLDVEVLTKDTQAWIGNGGTITTTGNVTVDAKSAETATSLSVGGTVGGTAAVTVNAGVSVYDVTTQAYIANGTNSGNGAKIFADGSVRISADERLELNVVGGNISGGGTAAVGAAVAVPVVLKNTHAWIGDFAQVNGRGALPLDVVTGSYTVTAVDTRFNPANAVDAGARTIDLGYAHGFSDGDEVVYDNGQVTSPPDPKITSISGLSDGGVYYVKTVPFTNKVQLFSNPGLTGLPIAVSGGTGESHRLVPTNQAGVVKDGANRFDPNAPGAVDPGNNTFKLPYTFSVSNDDAIVYSAGGGKVITGLVDGQTYYYKDAGGICAGCFQLLDKRSDEGGVVVDIGAVPAPSEAGRSHSFVPGGRAPSADAASAGPRSILLTTTPYRGVAVTASNSDDVGSFGIGLGIGGTAAVSLAGSINVDTIHTSAHIGGSAKVNCNVLTSCADNVPSANVDQSVRVAAANQFYELGIAVSVAVGGTAGVAVPVGVRVANIDTSAWVGNNAAINAMRDIAITANSKETVVSVAVGVGGGTVGVAGTISVTVLNVHTYACTGTPTDVNQPWACLTGGADLISNGNVLVAANGTTKLVLVTIALAGGYVGVGAAVGVGVLNKDTQAYLGSGHKIRALGSGAGLGSIYDGTLSGSTFGRHGSFNGLAVQASSSEDVFGLTPAVGGGFVGVAGGVSVTVMNVVTKAFVGPSAQINCNDACTALVGNGSVNVSAVDSFKSLTVAGGAAGGFVGVAGGIDIGIANTSVQAYLGAGSKTYAGGDVEVNGVSRKEVQTYALSIGAGAVGVAASVSVWTVGTKSSGAYHDSGGGPDRGNWSSTVANDPDSADYYHKGDVVTWAVSDGGDGKRYAAKLEHPLGNPGNSAQWQGESDAYQGNEDSITGADDVAGGGGGGYTSAFAGTTSSAPAPVGWSNGATYDAGDVVTYNDGSGTHKYQALIDITGGNVGKNPKQFTALWANADSQFKTSSRISAAQSGPQSRINAAAASVGGSVATTAISTVPSGGTTATVDGTVVANGHIHVWATDNLDVFGIAGAAAGGLGAVGAAVLVLNVKSRTDAGVGPSASLSAGGQVSVSASMIENSTGIALQRRTRLRRASARRSRSSTTAAPSSRTSTTTPR